MLGLLARPHIIASTKGAHKLSRDGFSAEDQKKSGLLIRMQKSINCNLQDLQTSQLKKTPMQKLQRYYVLRIWIILYFLVLEKTLWNTPWENATQQIPLPPTTQPIDKHFWLKKRKKERCQSKHIN